MSHEYRQLMLEQKIMVSPVPMVAALRIGRTSSAPRSTRPRKRASAASAAPRPSVSKASRAKRTAGANPSLHRFNQLEARLAKGPRKPRAKRAGKGGGRRTYSALAAAPGGLLANTLARHGY